MLIHKYFYLACVTDRYPPKLPKKCKEIFSCAQLRKDKKCSMSYEDAMSKNCNDKISRGLRSQFVENYCKRSCLNCPGNFVFFFVFHKSFRYLCRMVYMILIETSFCRIIIQVTQ